MADLGKAYVEIVPSAKGIKAKIEKELAAAGMGDAGESAGNGLGGKLLGGLKTAFTAAAVGKIVKDTFEAGGALQQSFGGLDTLYGDAAAGAKEYAFQAAQAGISANDYAEQAVSFGAALKAAYGGDTQKAMEAANAAIMDMADNAAKMGTPLESVQAAYQGFAKGQYQLLDNLKLGYGGSLSEAERLLKDAEKISGVHYDLKNLGDVYTAIHVIQENLGLTGVAADEAKTTLTGSFGAMKASVENLMAAFVTGQGLEPAFANLTTSVGNFLQNVGNMVMTFIQQLPMIVGNLVSAAPAFLMQLADGIVQNLPIIVAAGVQTLTALILGLAQALPELIMYVPHLISELQTALIQNAPQIIQAGIELMGALFTALVTSIPTVLQFVPALFIEAVAAFKNIDWPSLGRDIINGIINGISNAARSLYNTVMDLAAGAWATMKNALGIGSPSKVFEQQIGRWIPAGVSVGIDDNMAPLNASIVGMADDMTGNFERATMSGATAAPTVSQAVGIDYAKLAQAISSRPVVIEGDTSRIFKVVQRENRTRTVATNYNILAAPARG